MVSDVLDSAEHLPSTCRVPAERLPGDAPLPRPVQGLVVDWLVGGLSRVGRRVVIPVGTCGPRGCVLPGVTESPALPSPADCSTSPDSDEEESLRPGPLWRHALWVAGVTVVGVGWAWAGASFRVGPDDYGLPLATPGEVRPYLMVWSVTGLVLAVVVRAVAARVVLIGPEVVVLLLTFMGTRLSLGWRPESPALGAMVAAALMAAVVWCALALRRGRPQSA